MERFLNELSTITISAQSVPFSDELESKLGKQSIAAEQAKEVRAFTFQYTSRGYKVGGYAVLPKVITTKTLPVIIYNRGGTKDFGSIKAGMLFKYIAAIAKWGYIVVGSQYPGNSLSEGRDDQGEESVQSILDLYPILEKLSVVDMTRIGMFGESRGGTMTYMALTRVKWVKAAATLAGAADLVRGSVLRPEMQQVYGEAFGGDEEGKKERSAVYWPEKFPDNVPLLLMHGTADWRVSPLDSIDLATKLYEHKKPFQLFMYEGGDHGLTQYKDEWQRQAKAWFDKYLKPIEV